MSLSTQKSGEGSIGKYKTRSITYSLLLLIIFINFVVVIFGIKSSSLTLDESYSHWFASLSYQKLWSEVPVFSIHPTLYYFLLKFWMSIFGDGVIALRSLSASFGIIAIPFVFIAGRNLFNGSNANQVGLLAALFFSISPLQLKWALLARPYSLMALGVAITCAGLTWYVSTASAENKKIGSSEQIQSDVCLVLGAAIVLWSHNMGTLFVASVFMYFVWWATINKSCPRPIILRFITLGFIAFLIWLPHAFWVFQQTITVTTNIFYVPELTPSRFIRNIVTLYSNKYFLPLPSFVLFMVLCYFGIKAMHIRQGTKHSFFIISLLLFPFIFEILISIFLIPLMVVKFHVWSLIPYFITIAIAIVSIPQLWLRAPLSILIVIISVIGFYNSRQNFELEIWAKIANTTRNTDNHIPVVIYPNDHSLGYTYHVSKLPNYKGEFLDKVVIVPTPFPELNLNRPTMAGVPIVKKEDVSEVLTSIDHANEFWLVHDKREFLDPNFEFIIELNKHYELIEPHIWGGKYRKKH